ncbi:MAG: hypothetical protein KKF50_05475 [Nanoarchaeota archaeon]|nr:hypothetical protein [Nanoarchaeota archaeon]
MGYLYVILSVFCPRVFMFFAWLMSDWFSRTFETRIWPFLGFLFMPFITLAYMATMLNNEGSVSGGWIVLLIVGVLFDLGGSSSVSASRNSKNS